MLVNEYRLEIQFKKVRKVRNIINIPMVGSRPLECRPVQNGLYMVFNQQIIIFFISSYAYVVIVLILPKIKK
jgi:hypothetical protein